MRPLYIILAIAVISSSCCGSKSNIDNAGKMNTDPLDQSELPRSTDSNTWDEQIEQLDEDDEMVISAYSELQMNTDVIERTGENQELQELEATIPNSSESFDHSAWNVLLQKYVDSEGHVNYRGFKNNRSGLNEYISSLGENMPNDSWSKNDKLAYWINAYNALTVDLIVRNYPLKSIKDINNPWDQRLWQLGSKWYNLDEIEHQILRKMNEPRIHFGIVCASFSCPKLLNEAFIASRLEEQLTRATREFLADSKRNNISANEVKLSKIFQWFSKDFKQNGTLIDFLNRYSEITIAPNAKKRFKDYNWDLNE